MLFTSLIERKRDGGSLTPSEWRALVAAYLREEIPDYQMAAFLMAIVWRGLSPEELAALTAAMLESGDRLAPGTGTAPRVDKHSTGGVGDKVSLVLAPLVASCGVAVPMMSGRGLGHTGGTTDKLESIPGLRTDLALDEVRGQLDRLGIAMFGQTERVAPADRRLYALRDVTGTVPSIPLIAASIMSKKLAEGLTGLVLDVKAGNGAFMRTAPEALELARIMVGIGEAHGCATTALVTAMDRPLGRAIGNSLELEEAIQALTGEGPEDLLQLTLALGEEMLLLAGVTRERGAARQRLEQSLASGRALDCLRALVEAQGGDPAVVEDPGLLPQAAEVELYEAPTDGHVAEIDGRLLGEAVVELGGGRRQLTDPIDHTVGFIVTARPGRLVHRGEPIASVFASNPDGVRLGLAALSRAIRLGDPEPALPLLLARVTAAGIADLSLE